MSYNIPETWQPILAQELEKPYFHTLQEFVAEERGAATVFPPEQDVYNALSATPYAVANVLLLGQDPYHDENQAHGLCFSVQPGIRPPPSLVNIFTELKSDLGCHIPDNGYLVPWSEQGILMLNAVLTVRAHQPNSHKGRGWETFTDAILRKLNEKESPVIFVLWGGYAQKKLKLIDTTRHKVIVSAHPSPLSAHNGFFGSKPFSAINQALREAGKPEVNCSYQTCPQTQKATKWEIVYEVDSVTTLCSENKCDNCIRSLSWRIRDDSNTGQRFRH